MLGEHVFQDAEAIFCGTPPEICSKSPGETTFKAIPRSASKWVALKVGRAWRCARRDLVRFGAELLSP